MLQRIARIAAIAVLAAGAFAAMPALADEPPPAAPAPAADVPIDSSGFYFTPRFWYITVTTAQSSYLGATTNEAQMPMYGGTLTWAPAGWGGTALSVTGLFGTGTGKFYERAQFASHLDGDRDIQRLDVEALVQWRVGDAGGTFHTGARYVNFDSHAKGADQFFGTPFDFKDNVSLYLGEMGWQGKSAIDEKGTFFGGITMGFGYRIGDSDGICCGLAATKNTKNALVGSFDLNAGMSYAFSPSAIFSFRYRMFVLSETIKEKGDNTGLELGIVHGPELNFTWKVN